MKEYIEREAAIAKIRYDGLLGSGYSNEERENNAVDMFESIPAADVRPERYARKVKFFEDPWTLKKFTTCTACDWKVGPRDKFCKHCGAKFEEVTNG